MTALRCAAAIAASLLAVGARAQGAGDATFQEAYRRQYDALGGVAPDLLVMEMRDRVELIASRGSQVGAASNERRVRGFEAALLQGLQGALCGAAAPPRMRPSPAVVDRIAAAATAQRLKAQPEDLAGLAALSQRLVDGQPKERLCALTSLDDVR